MAGAIAFEDATVSALSSAVAVAFAVSVAVAARAAHVDVGERILAALALLACLLAARERVSARRARARADRAESAVREDRAFHASLRAQLRISLNSALGFAALAVERDRDVRTDRSDRSDRDRPPGSILRSPDDDFQRAVIDATDATRALIDLADDHADLLDAVSSVSASSSDPSPRFPPLVATPARLSRARASRRNDRTPTRVNPTDVFTLNAIIDRVVAAAPAAALSAAASSRRDRYDVKFAGDASRLAACVVAATLRAAENRAGIDEKRGGASWVDLRAELGATRRGDELAASDGARAAISSEDLAGMWTEVRFVATPRAVQGADEVPTDEGADEVPGLDVWTAAARAAAAAMGGSANRVASSSVSSAPASGDSHVVTVPLLRVSQEDEDADVDLDFDFVPSLPGAAGRRALFVAHPSLPPFARKHARGVCDAYDREMIDAATDEDAASRVESAIARGAHPILIVDARDAAEGRAPAADRAADVGGSVVAVARSRRDARTKTKTPRFATVASPATSEEMHAALCDAMTRAARRTASDTSVAEEANAREEIAREAREPARAVVDAPSSTPKANGSPLNANGSPPNVNGSPPNANGSPPSANGSPPNANGSPPNANGSPPKASPPASLSSAKFALKPDELVGLDVLVVEDNEFQLRIVEATLKNSGVTLDVAMHGREAVDHVRRRMDAGAKMYDVVFMDSMMPVMDGATATREIRKLELERLGADVERMLIVGLSAEAGEKYEEDARDAGMDGALSKPCRPETMRKTLKEVREGRWKRGSFKRASKRAQMNY